MDILNLILIWLIDADKVFWFEMMLNDGKLDNKAAGIWKDMRDSPHFFSKYFEV